MAAHLLQFWQDIERSTPSRDEVGESGVTWTELALALMLDRQVAIPTRIPNSGRMTHDISQLRNGGYGFFHVPKSFFRLAQCVNKALGGALFRGLDRGRTLACNGWAARTRVVALFLDLLFQNNAKSFSRWKDTFISMGDSLV